MFYWGRGDRRNVILSAESIWENLNRWKGFGYPLLEPESKPYNINGPSFPFVVKVDENIFFMYFVGWGKSTEGKIPNTTGLAISKDKGKTWRYYKKNPILKLDKPWDREGTGSVCVIRRKDEFWMYYTAISEYFHRPEGVKTGHGDVIPKICIALAFSKNGVDWEKYGPILSPRGFDAEPYEYIVSKPFILEEEWGYRMWFNSFGQYYRIQEAYSFDGIRFEFTTKKLDDYFGTGKSGDFDDEQRSYACVVKKNFYHMWYTGNDFGTAGIGYARGTIKESKSAI